MSVWWLQSDMFPQNYGRLGLKVALTLTSTLGCYYLFNVSFYIH
jgi:hypothetical protein